MAKSKHTIELAVFGDDEALYVDGVLRDASGAEVGAVLALEEAARLGAPFTFRHGDVDQKWYLSTDWGWPKNSSEIKWAE